VIQSSIGELSKDDGDEGLGPWKVLSHSLGMYKLFATASGVTSQASPCLHLIAAPDGRRFAFDLRRCLVEAR
jgi:hypothetical protein